MQSSLENTLFQTFSNDPNLMFPVSIHGSKATLDRFQNLRKSERYKYSDLLEFMMDAYEGKEAFARILTTWLQGGIFGLITMVFESNEGAFSKSRDIYLETTDRYL